MLILLRYTLAVAKHRRRITRAERRRLERQAANRAAREAGAVAAEEAEQRPREARSRHQLEVLAAVAAITNEQARAGARFFLDFAASGPETRLRMPAYQPGPRPPKKHPGFASGSLAQEAARRRFERAGAVLDPLEHAVVFHTCVCDLPPGAWSPPIGFGNEPFLILLRRALDVLAQHYGWARVMTGAPRLQVPAVEATL
jgi:hypothetical protein